MTVSRPDSRGCRRALHALHACLFHGRRTFMTSAGETDTLGVNAGFVGGRKIQPEARTSLQLETEPDTVAGRSLALRKALWLGRWPSRPWAGTAAGLSTAHWAATVLTPGSPPVPATRGQSCKSVLLGGAQRTWLGFCGLPSAGALSVLSGYYSSPVFSNRGFL